MEEYSTISLLFQLPLSLCTVALQCQTVLYSPILLSHWGWSKLSPPPPPPPLGFFSASHISRGSIATSKGRKMVRLRASDGTDFELGTEAAMLSGTIRSMMDELDDASILHLDIDSRILSKVIEYCTVHAFAACAEDADAALNLKAWDAAFIKVDDPFLSDLISASEFLKIKRLQLLTISKRILTIRTSHEAFAVEGKVTMKIKLLGDMLRSNPTVANSPIFLPNFPALSHVIEYHRKHLWAEEKGLSKNDIQRIDSKFIKMHLPNLFDLIRAGAYLQTQSLLKLAVDTAKTADEFAQLSPEDIIAKIVEQHYTKAEEKAIVATLSDVPK